MPRTIFVASAFAILASFAARSPVLAADPPYLRLAQAFGTPTLADSKGPRDKSLLLLNFVRKGETYGHWTKMTTVSILHIPVTDTGSATRGVITRLRAKLKASHATVRTFDESPVAPVTSYFEFNSGKEADSGIVYSPDPGFVTVAQLRARGGAKISNGDVAKLKHIIGR